MANERQIDVVIKAADDFSVTFEKLKTSAKDASQAGEEMEQSTGKLNRELDKLGDISEYAGSGLKKIRNMIEGMAFGVVIGAVSALTAELIGFVKEALATEEVINKLNTAVSNQQKAWKLLPEPMGAVTQATVNLYNAQLAYLQLLERDKGEELEKMVKTLNQVKQTMIDNPEWAGNFGNSVEQIQVKIAEAEVALEKWRQTMGMTPITVDKVKESLMGAAASIKAVTDATSETVVSPNMGFFDAQVEAFKKNLSELEKLNTERLALEQKGLDDSFTAQETYEENLLNLRLKSYDQEKLLNEMKVQTVVSMASNMTDTMQSLFVATGSNNEKMFAAYKVFAVAQSLIDTYLAINKTLAQGGWWAIPLAVSVGAMGFANAAAIASQEMTGSASSTTTTSTGETISTGEVSTVSDITTSTSSTPTQDITINIYNPLSDENWQKIVEDNIVPAINDAADRNINITVNG